MKIAFVINSFPEIYETFISSQIVGLLKRGHDVTISADRLVRAPPKVHEDVERFRLRDRTLYREPMPNSKLERLQSAVSRVLQSGWRRPRRLLDSLNVLRYGQRALCLHLLHERFPKPFISGNYDVIHCHFGPNGQRAIDFREAGLLRGPIITTFHGYDVNRLPRIYGVKLYKDLFACCEMFTIGSDFMRQKILSLGAPGNRVVKLPMGVDVAKYRFVERQMTVNGEFRLLTVGRLVEVKGIEYALRALAIAKNQLQDFRYTIAGDGPLSSKLEALTTKLGLGQSVKFVGTVSQEEIPHMYEASHVFVLPAVVSNSGEEEGQSVVLAEAQATGLPIVATTVGGIPESVRDGESGLLVPSRNPEALASAILWLFNHPETWARMGHAGRALVEERFNLETLNNQLVGIYRRVMNASLTQPSR